MTKSKSKVVLGQEVFVLSPQGDIVRTMVAKLESEGYTLLNGDSSRRPHWTSYEDAVQAARNSLEARRAVLRKTLRQLAARDRELQTERYRHGVASAAYKMVDLGGGWDDKRSRTRTRKHVLVPETYMWPCGRAYVIITPRTPPHSSSGWAVYRPYGHFVLETEVRSVRIGANGMALYAFTTPFRPEECFLSRKEAEARLQSYSEPGTLEQVHFVSREEETKALAELAEDDIPF